jgi:N-acetylmuramoyl-L-alanine amidase
MPLKHIVLQGECINSIAFEAGFFPDTVWNHADNKALKEKRKSMDELLPSDVVTIPDKKPKEVSKPPEKLHKFKRKGVPKKLRVRLISAGKPLKNAKCRVEVGTVSKEVSTDGDGWLEQWIPPNAETAHITIPDGSEFELRLGHRDPRDTLSGVQGRLHALGYYTGPVDGVNSLETRNAIAEFQRANHFDVTGKMDDKTSDRLKSLTGG